MDGYSTRLSAGAAADATRLPLADGSVDFLLVHRAYQRVDDQGGLFHELARVLRPGGAAHVTADNRGAVRDPGSGLPLLGWLPAPVADRLLRATGAGPGRPRTRYRFRGGLERRIRAAGLRLEDRTRRALEDVTGRARGWLERAVSVLPTGPGNALLRHLAPAWFLLVRRPRNPSEEDRPGRGGLLRARRRSAGRRRRRRRGRR